MRQVKGKSILAGAERYTIDTLAGEGVGVGWDRHQHESPGIPFKLESPVVL